MEISWFEIIAQIINFFVLLFILQKLFYKPVTKAMADRQERIVKAEKEAEIKTSEAEKLIKDYHNKIANIESERKSILDKSRKEALDNKDDLLKKYKQEADIKRKSFLNEVEEEKESFIKNLRLELGESAVKIASKILNTISSKELDEEVFNSFINDLKDIKRNIPNRDLLDEKTHVNLYSSQELSDDNKKEIKLTLQETIPQIENISYEVNKDLVLGYELNLETYTIHNSIKNYLKEVEDHIKSILESQNL